MKKVGILGGGESGAGAALLAKKLDMEVFLSDAGSLSESVRKELIQNKVSFEEKGHTVDRLVQMDVIVKSPGIPDETAIIRTLQQHGLSPISEIEWAFLHCEGKILAITGSNGKTTTTTLCHHLMVHVGIDAAMCGNVGTGFCRVLTERPYDWYVVEVSSFQLDNIVTFRPDIGILLNITPDHLNRYEGKMELYAAAKMKIAAHMQPADVFIYNAADPLIGEMLEKTPIHGVMQPVTGDVSKVFGIPSDALPGAHNALNAACAILAMRVAGVSDEKIRSGLQSFERPAHRMEFVGEVNDVKYINDSKATNVDSVFYALDAMKTPVIWIAGGQDKGNDYGRLDPLLHKVKMLICLGIDNKNLIQAFSSKVEHMEETTSMFEAVTMAASNASPGDTVLLSPACASFDLFRNYMDRGDQFREEVLKKAKA